MPFIAALWLAIVHALALPTAPHAHELRAVPVGVHTAHRDDRLGRAASVPARAALGGGTPRDPDAALRGARQVTGALIARAAGPSAHGSAPRTLVGPPCPRPEDPPATALRTAARRSSHAAVARGGVLPYFPTAPPLQG